MIKSYTDIPQPKQGWSEEDEYNVAFIVETLLGLDGDKEYLAKYKSMAKWLKSLKERYTWKPSADEIKALADALSLAKNCGAESAFDLRTLYEQLKKLTLTTDFLIK